jgi:ribosomal protein L11 methyltransferase
MKDRIPDMPDPSATVVAQLSTDTATAWKIDEAFADSFGEVVTTSFEEPDGSWSLALHFRDPPDETLARALVAGVAGPAAAAALTFETLAFTDWVTQSLDGLTPVEVGRFVVHSRHHRMGVRANRIAIEIEASLAFGTGHHGTTRGCLIALDRIAKSQRARNILDVGTGSGVLAIAAAKALRAPVLASDIDAVAVRVARENARLNRVGALVEVIHAAGLGRNRFRQRAPFALILANILLSPLQQLATPMARLAAPGGYIVLSGLLSAQAGPALASYRARGLVLARRVTLGGWTTLVLARPARRIR